MDVLRFQPEGLAPKTDVSVLHLRYYAPALMQKAGRTAPFQAMHILAEANSTKSAGIHLSGRVVGAKQLSG